MAKYLSHKQSSHSVLGNGMSVPRLHLQLHLQLQPQHSYSYSYSCSYSYKYNYNKHLYQVSHGESSHITVQYNISLACIRIRRILSGVGVTTVLVGVLMFGRCTGDDPGHRGSRRALLFHLDAERNLLLFGIIWALLDRASVG